MSEKSNGHYRRGAAVQAGGHRVAAASKQQGGSIIRPHHFKTSGFLSCATRRLQTFTFHPNTTPVYFTFYSVNLRTSVGENQRAGQERSKIMKQSQCILTSNTYPWDAGHTLKDGGGKKNEKKKTRGLDVVLLAADGLGFNL